jgi:ribonuclease D
MATRIAHTYDGRYMVFFDDDAILTTLTDSGDVVDFWLNEICRIHRRRLRRLVVGLDVEWRPSYSRYDAPPPVAVLQICVGHRCLVFQILHADYLPDALFDFLADDRVTFVGVGIHGDVAKLRAGYGLEVVNAVDLRHLAAHELGNSGLCRAGLPALVREVMGVQMEKPYHVRRSPWDSRQLSYDQLKYACADAFASFEVGRRLYDGDY